MKMKPHDEISLDFDFIFRKPLFKVVDRISRVIYSFMLFCDKHVLHVMQFMGSHLADPYLWTEKSHSIRIRNMSFENEEKLIGDVIQAAVAVTSIIIVLTAVL